jgi:hypothetical protein
MMRKPNPSRPEKQEYSNKPRVAVDPSQTDIITWADLRDLAEDLTSLRRL